MAEEGSSAPQAQEAPRDSFPKETGSNNQSTSQPKPIKRRRRSYDGDYMPTPTHLGGHHTSYRRNRSPRHPRHRRQNSGHRPHRPPYFATNNWGPWHCWINGKATDPEHDPPATEDMLETTRKFEEQYGEELKGVVAGAGEDAKKIMEWNYPVWWLSQGQWIREDGLHAEMRWMALSVLNDVAKRGGEV